MKAIFDTKPTSGYDDLLSQHYHFPKRYLSIAEGCVGDWVILRRPRADGGNLAYFAAAKISKISVDKRKESMFFACFEDFVSFSKPVPWNENNYYRESDLRNMPRQRIGIFLRGRSVREVSDDDFHDIVVDGFGPALKSVDRGLPAYKDLIEDFTANATLEMRRRKVRKILTSRLIRDSSFRLHVYEAYDHRCALTGLKITDSKGNSEVQAAHIQAVADQGPDIIQNGIALSATIHWMFDHHLISLTDDYRTLFADEIRLSPIFSLLGSENSKANLPRDRSSWPHPHFLAIHRSTFMALNSSNPN